MTIRYIVAFILTFALLALARRVSTRHTSEYTANPDGITLSHNTVTEDFGDGPVLFVRAPSDQTLNATAFYSEKRGGPYDTLTLSPIQGGFSGRLPALPKGRKWFYHIDVVRNGEMLATFPPVGDQFIKFKGHVSELILIPHIFFMFATIFCGVMALFTSLDIARGKGDVRRSVQYVLWTMIFAFIGGFPLGSAVAYQAFGQAWAGVPIGWDITDNKTLILFIFWVVTFILAAKGLKREKMAISSSLYAFLVILSFVVTFATFLIPHSI